ncbi:MAG: hypothetical protein U9R49_00680 [Bacteroidota bacterium]|nr:hypothetical protein [Bacteroidota bacterium]
MRRPLTITVLTALLGLSGLYAQQESITDYLAECERKYGNDADLVNGEKYYYPYRQSEGTPFFFDDPHSSVIKIREKEFAGQLLRYDIFNQKLILDFMDIYGANSSLVLRNEWVEAFAFGEKNFIRMQGPEGETGFYQLVTNGTIKCVYKWSKDQLLNLTSGVQSYYFTDATKDSYLVIGGTYYAYRNNRTFLKAFNPELQKTVKQFMKQSRVKVNKAPDSQMRHLVHYCNSLSNEDS